MATFEQQNTPDQRRNPIEADTTRQETQKAHGPITPLADIPLGNNTFVAQSSVDVPAGSNLQFRFEQGTPDPRYPQSWSATSFVPSWESFNSTTSAQGNYADNGYYMERGATNRNSITIQTNRPFYYRINANGPIFGPVRPGAIQAAARENTRIKEQADADAVRAAGEKVQADVDAAREKTAKALKNAADKAAKEKADTDAAREEADKAAAKLAKESAENEARTKELGDLRGRIASRIEATEKNIQYGEKQIQNLGRLGRFIGGATGTVRGMRLSVDADKKMKSTLINMQVRLEEAIKVSGINTDVQAFWKELGETRLDYSVANAQLEQSRGVNILRRPE